MRHAVFGQKLSRDINERKALLANLASAILEKGQLTTTLAKAKFAQSYVEKLVTKAKKNRLHLKRALASRLSSKAFMKLTDEIGPGFAKRQGGYTRLIKLGRRLGDAAPQARLEFLEWDKSFIKISKQKPVGKKKKVKTGKKSQDSKKTKEEKK